MSRRRRKGRSLNGLLLLDKPSGITSNQALQKAKNIFNAEKAGHTGSLDPLATGLLVICFGRATKISTLLLDSDKHYRVTLKLGVTTETGDAEGQVKSRQNAVSVTDAEIHQAMTRLTGNIEQVPPMYSALKFRGMRLYQLARKGIEVERPSRSVKVYQFSLTEREENILHMKVSCSKGTYIRTLVEDLGQLLGCGAHVVQLRRIGLGPFVEQKFYKLSKLEEISATGLSLLDELLLPVDEALHSCPALSFDEGMMEKVRNGRPVSVSQLSVQEMVRIYDASGHFFGIGTVMEDRCMAIKRLN